MADYNKNMLMGISPLLNQTKIRSGIDVNRFENDFIRGDTELLVMKPEPRDTFDDEINRITGSLNLDLNLNLDSNSDSKNNSNDDEEEDDDIYDVTNNWLGVSGGGGGGGSGDNEPSIVPRSGGFLETRTKEEVRRKHVAEVLHDIHDDDDYDLEKEKREDFKIMMLESIETMADSLKQEGVKLNDSYNVNEDSSYESVERVYKKLKHKIDRLRYCTVAEEFILWGCRSLEDVFDGEKIWFGRYRPDLVGWHRQVNVKLRRMRHDTSQVVNNVMNDYNLGTSTRMLMELIPSAVMYSNNKNDRRKGREQEDDDYMRDANNRLRDLEEDD